MSRRTTGLADRLRAAVERERSTQSAEETARLDRLAEGRRAREELFADLVAFAGETGFLEVIRKEEGAQFSWNGRSIRFIAQGEGEAVAVDYGGLGEHETNRLYREPALGGRWVWVRTRGRREDRLPLFDQGLELLLVHALGLPEPDAAAPQPTPTRAAPKDAPPDAAPDALKRRL